MTGQATGGGLKGNRKLPALSSPPSVTSLYEKAFMAITVRRAQITWEGPLASGTGVIRTGSGAAGELPVTRAARTDGKTSPEELAAAAHSACHTMALALRLGEHKAARNG